MNRRILYPITEKHVKALEDSLARAHRENMKQFYELLAGEKNEPTRILKVNR